MSELVEWTVWLLAAEPKGVEFPKYHCWLGHGRQVLSWSYRALGINRDGDMANFTQISTSQKTGVNVKILQSYKSTWLLDKCLFTSLL